MGMETPREKKPSQIGLHTHHHCSGVPRAHLRAFAIRTSNLLLLKAKQKKKKKKFFCYTDISSFWIKRQKFAASRPMQKALLPFVNQLFKRCFQDKNSLVLYCCLWISQIVYLGRCCFTSSNRSNPCFGLFTCFTLAPEVFSTSLAISYGVLEIASTLR